MCASDTKRVGEIKSYPTTVRRVLLTSFKVLIKVPSAELRCHRAGWGENNYSRLFQIQVNADSAAS